MSIRFPNSNTGSYRIIKKWFEFLRGKYSQAIHTGKLSISLRENKTLSDIQPSIKDTFRAFSQEVTKKYAPLEGVNQKNGKHTIQEMEIQLKRE